MTILSQAKSLEGKIQPWANTPLGLSANLIHAKGDQLVLLSEILDVDPITVNEDLKIADAFIEDQIRWEKLPLAFPEWSAQVFTPYNNDIVLDALSNYLNVIVLTDKQAIRYIGAGKCHDPKTGTERPTSDFPDVQSFIIIKNTPVEVRHEETTPVDNVQTDSTVNKQKGEEKEVAPKKKPGRKPGFHPAKKTVETDPKKALKKYLHEIRSMCYAIDQLYK